MMAGCPPPPVWVPPPPPIVAATRPMLWVDGGLLDDGDGTKARPFKRLPKALEAAAALGAELRVESGLYEGPFIVPAGVRIVGIGLVVLHADGPAALLAADRVELESLTIQGGLMGLVVQGDVTLRNVSFSGQRQVAL